MSAIDGQIQAGLMRAALEQAQMQELQGVLGNPAMIIKCPRNLVATAIDQTTGDLVLLVATPGGTRLDIPMNPQAMRNVGHAMVKTADGHPEQTSEGTSGDNGTAAADGDPPDARDSAHPDGN